MRLTHRSEPLPVRVRRDRTLRVAVASWAVAEAFGGGPPPPLHAGAPSATAALFGADGQRQERGRLSGDDLHAFRP